MAEIFLSHSGSQKSFVVCLTKSLQAAGHSPFLDVISLPKAEPFPPHIEEALRNCKLGVVVLSEEFMTSHWPMRELALLHLNPSAKILPLFYNLSPHDLKSEENLSRWRPKWKELGEKHGMDTSQWEKVVGLLPSLNGELILPGSNDASYIDKVVKEICRLVPLSPHYDVVDVNGGSRLCEVIMSKFEVAQSACKSTSCACTIALHGVGGAGKTTICKLMANAYSSHYSGKSVWLEFPFDGNKKSIAKEFKKLLRQCTNASDEHVLSRANSLYEILPELDKRMSEHPIFLAIDNIWESTSEEAGRLLQVKFNKESKILVTSRSRAVLRELLKGCDEATCIDAVPSMKREEALSTFGMWFGHDLSYVPHKLLDEVLKLCLFEETYHPLALKSLGKRLGRLQDGRIILDHKEMEAHISHLSHNMVDANIEKLIRINYDSIPLIRQHIFLDIVVVFLSDAFKGRRNEFFFGGYDATQKGLRILYTDEQHSEHRIDELMQQLAWDGLLDFEGVDEKRRIVVHDLYLELARREAIASPRFFLGDGQEMNSRDWSMVKRVVIPKDMEDNLVKVMEKNCPRLEVLIAIGSWNYIEYFKGELKLGEHMGALRILILQHMYLDISTSMGRWFFRLKERPMQGKWLRCVGRPESRRGTGRMQMHGWRGCVGRLAWLELVWCKWRHALEAVYGMDKLEVLILNDCQGPWKKRSKLCHGCSGLQELYVQGHPFNDRISSSVWSLSKLRKLRLVWVPNLKTLAVGANVQLLEVHHCQDLEEICSLQGLITLFVADCRLLKAITGGLNGPYTQLQRFRVFGCEALEEIPGLHGLINLKHLSIERCPQVKSIAHIKAMRPLLITSGTLLHLTQIEIWGCGSLEEIPAITGLINLKGLDISYCPRLKAILLDLRDAVQLQEIRLESCESLEEIPTLHALINLKRLVIQYCPRLKAIPNWSGAAQLEHIDISKRALTNPELVRSSPRAPAATISSTTCRPASSKTLACVLCISHE